MEYNINLVIGDYYDDGHGKSSLVNINSNLALQEICNAYNEGIKNFSFDWCRDVCSNYEDNIISNTVYDELNKSGLTIAWLYQTEDTTQFDWRADFFHTEYAMVYLWIAKLGNSNLEFKVQSDSNISVGGYGLFNG